MCLAVPLVLKEIIGTTGIGERDGVFIEIDLSLVPEAVIGDELIVHVGIALSVIDRTEEE